MAEGIAFAHEHGVKVYVTVNILAHNDDLPGVREYLQELKGLKPDALIIADPGIFTYAKEICPEIECHISTQANNTNYETYRFWYRLGAKRVVTAGDCVWEKSEKSESIFPRIWKLKPLFTGQCVFPIQAVVFSAVSGGKRCQQRRLHPSVPVEIFYCGREKTGRIYAGF